MKKEYIIALITVFTLIIAACKKDDIDSFPTPLESYSGNGAALKLGVIIEQGTLIDTTKGAKYPFDSVICYDQNLNPILIEFKKHTFSPGYYITPFPIYIDSIDRANAFDVVNKRYYIEIKPLNPNDSTYSFFFDTYTKFAVSKNTNTNQSEDVYIYDFKIVVDREDTLQNQLLGTSSLNYKNVQVINL